MPVLIDFHVLAQALLYFASVACGLVISIPLGVTQSNFHGNCLLYSTCNWVNATHFLVSYQPSGICSFPVYVSVIVGILYAVGMGVYYIYAITRKDPNIGSQMWVLPFTLINSLVTVVFFVAACVISVGFKVFCDSYAKGDYEKSCASAQKATWYDGSNGSTLYTYINVSQVAAWAMFLIWLVQTALGFLRIIRNRRQRSQGIAAGGLGGHPKAEDSVNVVAAEPTA